MNIPYAGLSQEEFQIMASSRWPRSLSAQPALSGGTFTDNDPGAGSVSWASCVMEYNKRVWQITDDNTSDAWVYWDYASPNEFQTSATYPSVTENVIIIGKNDSGTFRQSWKAGQGIEAEMVVGELVAGQIAANSITTDHLAAGAVTAVKINVASLSAISANIGSITAGSIDGITITGSVIQTNPSGVYVTLDSDGFEMTNGSTSYMQLSTSDQQARFLNKVWTGDLDASDTRCNTLRVSSPSVPASAAATGSAGTIAWDSDYIYVCVATDTWKRAAITTWS